MAAGLRWLRGRLRSGEPLFLAADAHDGFGDDRRELLALSTDVEPDAAEEAALIRAEHLEARFREEIGDVAERDEDEALDDDRNDEALLAIGALAIAYFGRGAMDLATSPLEMRGGLTLPAVIAVLGHAYSQANRLFW
ncbi:MAG: hypothetical protein QOH76_3494 [Thermoleophilaceae bacterium]|jgi:hypothetical protein|nr:hypothetical protein [Thermoleophilaceae bacterium]